MPGLFKFGEREITSTVAIPDVIENDKNIIVPAIITVPNMEFKETSKIMWVLVGILCILAVHFINALIKKFQLWRNTRFLAGRQRTGKIY